jgi:chemotaxis protein CheC
MSVASRIEASDLDRVRELASIGAGHAANALAQLTGRTCEMRVPTVRLHEAGAEPEAPRAGASERSMAGVLFEVEGGPGGVLALLFPSATCERLLAQLLGSGAHELRSPAARSALCEVGNILASHAANAVGETLGVSMLPSIPLLALHDARAALAALLARRDSGRPALRIESEICDRAHELCGIFVFVPDRLSTPDPVRAAARF